MRYLSGSLILLCLLAHAAHGQTCGLPAENCAGILHCGGDWEFEAGFYTTPHHLAGQCAAPPSGGNESCVPSNKTATLGSGWQHWASFPTWPTGGYWGTVSFNENKNCANVYRGNRSQELTLTCANGVGVIYRTAAVPADHRLRLEAYMKFTPNGTSTPVEYSLGIHPSGGTDPTSPAIIWAAWQEQAPSPPQPANVFNRGTVEAVSQGPTVTVFIRQRAFEPPCQGQTFLVDAVRVLDLGPNLPTISVQPTALQATTRSGVNPASTLIQTRNSGGGTLDYTVSDDAAWLSVSPQSGTSTGETDPLTVTYAATELPIGTHNGSVTVTATGASNSPLQIPVTLTVRAKPADLDHDDDVDQADFAVLQRCLTGSGLPQPEAACTEAKLDGDSDVDHADLQIFLGCMSGPNAMSSPTCD